MLRRCADSLRHGGHGFLLSNRFPWVPAASPQIAAVGPCRGFDRFHHALTPCEDAAGWPCLVCIVGPGASRPGTSGRCDIRAISYRPGPPVSSRPSSVSIGRDRPSLHPFRLAAPLHRPARRCRSTQAPVGQGFAPQPLPSRAALAARTRHAPFTGWDPVLPLLRSPICRTPLNHLFGGAEYTRPPGQDPRWRTIRQRDEPPLPFLCESC